MKPYRNIIYIAIIAALAIFAARLQLAGQLRLVEQALANQTAAVDALRRDIATIATFLNERTNVRVDVSGGVAELELESQANE